MWIVAIYLLTVFLCIAFFSYLRLTWLNSLILALVIGLLLISPLTDVRPLSLLSERSTESAFYFAVLAITVIVVFCYGFYTAATAPRKR